MAENNNLNFKQQPYLWLALVSVLLLIFSRLVGQHTLDLHAGHTYFVLALDFVYIVLASLLAAYALLYFLLRDRLFSPALSRWHVIGTVLIMLVIINIPVWLDRQVTEDPNFDIEQYEFPDRYEVLWYLIFAFILVQMTFIYNIFRTLFSKGKR